jgi:hypothetical protein
VACIEPVYGVEVTPRPLGEGAGPTKGALVRAAFTLLSYEPVLPKRPQPGISGHLPALGVNR